MTEPGAVALARALSDIEIGGKPVWFVAQHGVPKNEIGGTGEWEVAAVIFATLTEGERLAIAGITEDRLAAALADALTTNGGHIQHETSGYDMPVPGIARAILAALSETEP